MTVFAILNTKMKNYILLFMCLVVIATLCYIVCFVYADGIPDNSIPQFILAKSALIIFLVLSFPLFYLADYFKMGHDILPYAVALNLVLYTLLLPKIYSFIKLKLQKDR